jgi:hypothetical protein
MDREDDAVKLNLRLDESLHQQLAAEAKRQVRSLQGEIIFRLRKSLDQQSEAAVHGGRMMPAGNGATCPACGSQFRPQRSTARFCGPRCRVAANRSRDRGTPLTRAATRPSVARDAVLSVTVPIGVSDRQKPQIVTLRRKPLKLDPRIVPDPKWPGMYRIKRPDGSLSDMANLTRCRDGLRSFDEAADTFST